ncbi:SHOCT domain-containing protein [Streptomyces sp. 4R-3d]|uniref:SHOCT domain-containing protein n=1 Tax=Streptomyces sp. 4R-3d TaxID=2559605 RepID=UPI001072C083|nr:SHOCT domain-containing protein [Streptomyces sp. 4R-3d]TFI22051.1 SHOCT domain-containing protein [Streptomyces sp. 4R-3d]
MNALANSGGPGPWILLFPLVWAAVIVGGITLLRRTVWRGRRGGLPWAPGRSVPDPRDVHDERSPIALLGRRFAAGEIDEDEYWRRLSVLDEQFGRTGKGGAA